MTWEALTESEQDTLRSLIYTMRATKLAAEARVSVLALARAADGLKVKPSAALAIRHLMAAYR